MKVYVIRDDNYYNLNRREKEEIFKKSLSVFKKRVADSGVIQEYKKREYYESPGQKKRRKQKESMIQRKKAEKKSSL